MNPTSEETLRDEQAVQDDELDQDEAMDDEEMEDDAASTTPMMVGEYANYISVGSTQTEFYLDFFQVVPGSAGDGSDEQVLPVRRLLLSPMLIRGLMQALGAEVATYESTYHFNLPTLKS